MNSEERIDYNCSFFLACRNRFCHGFNPGLLILFKVLARCCCRTRLGCWYSTLRNTGSFPVSLTLGPSPHNAPWSVLFLFVVFYCEVFAWSFPYFWHNNFSNIFLTVPCCLCPIPVGNCARVPCSVDNLLSGFWRSVPCCFRTIFYDGLSEPQNSLYAIAFDGLGFVPCSLHSTFYGSYSNKRPSCHSLKSDWSDSSCVASYK